MSSAPYMKRYLRDAWESQPVERLWRELSPSSKGALLVRADDWVSAAQGTVLESWARATRFELLKLFAEESI